MKIMQFGSKVVLIVAMMTLAACGSSSSSSSSSGGDETTTGSSVVVDDLSDLPSLDLDAADTTSANFALPPPAGKSVADGFSTVGSTATAGCYAINFMKPVAMSQLKQGELFKCYVQTTQDSDPTLVIPTDSWGYFILDQGAAAPIRYIAARLGNFASDSTNTFKMEACESSDNSTYTKMMEMAVSGNTGTKTWSGHFTTHTTFPEAIDSMEGSVTGAFNNSEFSMVMSTAAALQEAFNIANVTSLTTTSTFGRNPSPSTSDATASTTYLDGFQVSFDYDSASTLTSGVLNTVTGSFSNGSSVTGIVKAKFNDTIGAGHLNYDTDVGTDFDSSEAFSVGTPAAGVVPVLIVDETGATYAGIFADVAGEDLASQAIVVPTGVTSAVAWQLDWDCAAPTGTTFTTIDASAVNYSACDALSTEIGESAETSAGVNCFGEGGGEGQGGGDFPNAAGTYRLGNIVSCPAEFVDGTEVVFTGEGVNTYTAMPTNNIQFALTDADSCTYTSNGVPADTCSWVVGGTGKVTLSNVVGACSYNIVQQ